MAEEQPQQPQQASPQNQPSFSIEKVYLKDLSLEIPHAPAIFTERNAPQVEIQMHTQATAVGDGLYESVLTTTVTAKIQEKVVFLVEAAQAGVFQIRNVPQQDLEPILHVTCPNILLPFTREAIASLVTRAGFPPVVLSPLNFEALYMKQREQAAAQAQAAAPASAEPKPTTH